MLSRRQAADPETVDQTAAPSNWRPVTLRTEQLIVGGLAERAAAIFVREPFVDARYPATSDADVLAFAEVDGLLPERLNLPAAEGSLPIDVIWLPHALLADAQACARRGLVLHRLADSRLLFDRDGTAARQQAAVVAAMRSPAARAARIDNFFDMGFRTVREIGVTWDMPSVALFWLHMTTAAALAAAAEALGLLCPNIYTRPFDCLRAIEARTRWRWRGRLTEALQLDADPAAAIARLRALHEMVVRRFPEPDWPASMRGATRAEYRYFGNGEELAWRIAVAREMAAAGDVAQAVHYLRFWAYSLARMPMVWHSARAGRDVSFVRPERAVGPALQEYCPEIVEPLDAILGGGRVGRGDIETALAAVTALRDDVGALLRERGVAHGEPMPWAPHQAISGVA